MTEYTPDDVILQFVDDDGNVRIAIPTNGKTRIVMPNTKHLYDVNVKDMYGNRGTIEVEANNRAQAQRFAERYGYEVFSINLVG